MLFLERTTLPEFRKITQNLCTDKRKRLQTQTFKVNHLDEISTQSYREGLSVGYPKDINGADLLVKFYLGIIKRFSKIVSIIHLIMVTWVVVVQATNSGYLQEIKDKVLLYNIQVHMYMLLLQTNYIYI